jgi:hypothetical protein
VAAAASVLDGDDVCIGIPQDAGGAGKFEAHYLAGVLHGYRISIEREQEAKRRALMRLLPNTNMEWLSWWKGIGTKALYMNSAHSPTVPMTIKSTPAAFFALMRRVTWHAA